MDMWCHRGKECFVGSAAKAKGDEAGTRQDQGSDRLGPLPPRHPGDHQDDHPDPAWLGQLLSYRQLPRITFKRYVVWGPTQTLARQAPRPQFGRSAGRGVDSEWFESHDQCRLRGTVRYPAPKAA